MKKPMLWTAGLFLLAAGGFGAFVSLQESKTPMGTTLAGKDVSGFTSEQLRAEVQNWWQQKQTATLQPQSKLLSAKPAPMSLSELGIEPDIGATLQGAPFSGYTDSLLGKEVKGGPIKIAWRQTGGSFGGLQKFISSNAKPKQAPWVKFDGGHFSRQYEIPSFALDSDRVGSAALEAMLKQKPFFEIPMKTGDVAISNKVIDSINVVVKSFTTNFSAGNVNRSHNIALAAESLNGRILMPGDVLSYNETVGQRNAKNGYKVAGVYANGRHEVDYGGGICQVSTTMFNAVALANLEIVSRTNHSMPVPYVPVGRDATVDYGSIDFKFRNSYDTPIAIASKINGGTLTFYVLGTKKLDVEVKMETSDHSAWGNKTQFVSDSSLAAGATKVIERGSMGRKCTTWRIVEKDGVEIEREKMFDSIYRASPRIVARGTRAKPKQKPAASPAAEPAAPIAPASEPVGGGGG